MGRQHDLSTASHPRSVVGPETGRLAHGPPLPWLEPRPCPGLSNDLIAVDRAHGRTELAMPGSRAGPQPRDAAVLPGAGEHRGAGLAPCRSAPASRLPRAIKRASGSIAV